MSSGSGFTPFARGALNPIIVAVAMAAGAAHAFDNKTPEHKTADSAARGPEVAQSAEAVRQTVAGNAYCTGLTPFYWEIGQQGGSRRAPSRLRTAQRSTGATVSKP